MRTFAATENNDIMIGGDGNLAIRSGQAAAVLVCEQYARASRGEMIHKMHRGIPFWPTAFGSNANLSQYEAAFRSRMGEIDEVIAVDTFIAEISNGVLKYEAEIRTVFGQVSINNG